MRYACALLQVVALTAIEAGFGWIRCDCRRIDTFGVANYDRSSLVEKVYCTTTRRVNTGER